VGLGTLPARAERQQLRDLGFRAVVLDVHVPLAPPAAPDPRRSLALGSWGDRVTEQGDGAVLAAARDAASLGLDVVLWPRFVAGRGGPLATQQTHPDAAAILALGRRYALAVEAAALLAERAQASALVLLEHELLPAERTPPPEIVDARAVLRQQAIAYARPFHGALVVLSRGVSRLDLAAARAELSAARAPEVVFGFHLGEVGPGVRDPSGALSNRLLSAAAAADGRLRVAEIAVAGNGPVRRRALFDGARAALESAEAVDLALLSSWGLGADDAAARSSFDLRGAGEDALRGLAAARSSGR
ncbi:MAG: hypothetical protein AAGB93_06320, partial [Planctomycetota bacterium]